MKKKFFKATFAVAAITTAGLGMFKAYGTYMFANMTDEELLMAENVLALSSGESSGSSDSSSSDSGDYYIGTKKATICWIGETKREKCSDSSHSYTMSDGTHVVCYADRTTYKKKNEMYNKEYISNEQKEKDFWNGIRHIKYDEQHHGCSGTGTKASQTQPKPTETNHVSSVKR